MTGIRAILFDFGGTLDHDGVDWFTRIYRGVISRHGPLDRTEFDSHADRAANYIASLADTPQLTMAQTARRLCEQILLEMQSANGDGRYWEPAEVAAEFVNESTTYLQRNRNILQQLQKRFRLGVISNNWGNTAGWCRQYELCEYLSTMVDSTVVGSAKPNRAIFDTAVKDLNLPAQACAYVGDRYDYDVLGAQAAGLLPIWLVHSEQTDFPDGANAIQQIHTLPDLLDLTLP